MTHLVRVSEDCRTLRKYTVGKMTDLVRVDCKLHSLMYAG